MNLLQRYYFVSNLFHIYETNLLVFFVKCQTCVNRCQTGEADNPQLSVIKTCYKTYLPV
nr:MAG TPA: hypothetical protein [Caudoviricetes sp.]